MALEIRVADDGKYHHLLDIDDEGNEKFIVGGTLEECKNHELAIGKSIPVVNEKDTRGTS